MMGGFSQTEIIAYLKAKQEAAKDVVTAIAADEETQSQCRHTATRTEKPMHASLSLKIAM